jgi:hypothetical protein
MHSGRRRGGCNEARACMLDRWRRPGVSHRPPVHRIDDTLNSVCAQRLARVPRAHGACKGSGMRRAADTSVHRHSSMPDPHGSIPAQAGLAPGLSAAELASLAAHAANNISALLVAAVALADEDTGPSPPGQGHAILAAGMARLHTLSSALHLLALEPAQVTLVRAHKPPGLGQRVLDRLRDDLARESRLELGSCPPLDDLPSAVDRVTLQSLLACLVECARRRLPETRSARLTWSCARALPQGGGAPVAAAWVFAIDLGADPSAALYQPRPGITEHAVAHAAVLLQPLGVCIEAGSEDRYRLVLVSPSPSAEAVACR